MRVQKRSSEVPRSSLALPERPGKAAGGFGRVLERFGEVLGGPGAALEGENGSRGADFRSLKR